MQNAYETLDSINEMGAKISNLDSKMIDFFKSQTNDNYEQNEKVIKEQFNRIESIERMIESGTAGTTDGGRTKMSLDPMTYIIKEENEQQERDKHDRDSDDDEE